MTTTNEHQFLDLCLTPLILQVLIKLFFSTEELREEQGELLEEQELELNEGLNEAKHEEEEQLEHGGLKLSLSLPGIGIQADDDP